MSNVVKANFKKRDALAMTCTACGAAGVASCDCGKPYVPATDRIEQVIKAEPNKGSRRIAAELGCDEKLVRKVRAKHGADQSAPLKRIGLDNKPHPSTVPSRKPQSAPKRIALLSDEPCTDCNTQQERWHRSLSNMAGEAISLSAYWTQQFGKDWQKFEVTSEVLTLAKQAAAAWKEIVESMINGEKGK